MDPKELSPAYLTSLASILIAALLVGASSNLLSALGWLLLFVGLGLNVFSTLVMVQRLKGGPLPAALTGERSTVEEETAQPVATVEPEPDTEAQQTVQPSVRETSGKTSDERIFRTRTPRPSVR